MRRLNWIKLRVDYFDGIKMVVLRQYKDCDELMLFWLELIALAGQINDGGQIYIFRGHPVAIHDLAVKFDVRDEFVERALSLFEELELIVRDEQGVIRILDWDDFA